MLFFFLFDAPAFEQQLQFLTGAQQIYYDEDH